jgi:hypothetical protein
MPKNDTRYSSENISTNDTSGSGRRKPMVPSLTRKRLKELLNYDPKTGIFTNIEPRRLERYGAISGVVNANGYIHISVDYRRYLAHRLAWFYVKGEWPNGDIDHINHKRDDNRISNLRVVTRTENMRNKTKSKNNSSGITGIYFDKTICKWRAVIRSEGKNHHLGIFKDKKDAASAYKAKAMELGFHRNHGKS